MSLSSAHQMRAPRRVNRAVRWAIEELEPRLLLANVSWTGAGDGVNWTNVANWSGSVLPGPNDDVTINVTSNATIYVNSGSQYVHSLVCNDKLIVSNGASLNVATTATIGANSAEDNSVFRGIALAGGELLGGTFSFNSQTTLNAYSGTSLLDNVTIASGTVVCNGNYPFNTGNLIVDGGLTLNGTLNIEQSGTVQFGDSNDAAGSLGGNATVNFLGTKSALVDGSGLTGASAVLTINPTVNLVFGSGSITNVNSGDEIVNQGTIQESGTAANTVSLGSTVGLFNNQASFSFGQNSGDLLTLGDFVNAAGATVSVQGPSTGLVFTGSLSNSGTINVTNVSVFLAGTFSQADMGTFNRTGGTVTVTGTIEGNLTLTSSTGVWEIDGSLNNGTITTSGSGGLDFTHPAISGSGGASQGTPILDNITIMGDLSLILGGYVYVLGTLTVTGTLTLGNASGTTYFEMYLGTALDPLLTTAPFFEVAPVALNAANIVFGPSTGNNILNETLQGIGKPGPSDPPAVTTYSNQGIISYYGGGNATIDGPIQGGSGYITSEFNYSTISIKDGVTANGSGSVMYVGGSQVVGVTDATVTNSGTMQAIYGGTLDLAYADNQDSVSASNDSTLELTGTISNHGTISASDSTVNLNATFQQADLGSFTRDASSTVLLTGTVNGNLNLNANTGNWLMYGGVVNGGTVTESGGAELAFTENNGTLVGVTFDGDMDLDGGLGQPIQDNASVKILGGLTLNGIMYLGNPGNNYFGDVSFGDSSSAPGTLGGDGTVVFGSGASDGGQLLNTDYTTGASLTIGPGISIRGEGGTIGAYTGDSIIFQGTLDDNIAGGNIDLGSSGNLFNSGTIQASGGGGVTLNNLTNEPGATIDANGGSTMTLSGTLLNLGVISEENSTANLGAAFTQAMLGSFLRTAGTVNLTGTISGGLALDQAAGSWVLNGGTIAYGAVNLYGGVSLIIGNQGGSLTDLTINGNVNGTQSNGAVHVYGGLVLNGTMSLAEGATFYFGSYNQPAYSLTGNATIVMTAYSGIYNASQLASQTLTLGPNITINGSGGTIGDQAADGTVLIQGTINSDVVGGALRLGNGEGSIVDQGNLQVNEGSVTLQSNFSLNGQGTINTSWNAGISVPGGTFAGNSTAYMGSNPSGTITLNGGGGASNPGLLEVMSEDEGDTVAGFTNNFVYGTLVVATPVLKLVDNSPNSPGTHDALYVNSLVVSNFDELNLNGINVYARAVEIGADASVVNGTITQLPDGGPIGVNSALPGAISPAGNVDNWTFFGRGGEVVTVYVNTGSGNVPQPISPNLGYASVDLLNSSSQVMASGSNSIADAGIALQNITLPTDGTYTIQVGAPSNRSSATGYYVVSVFDVTPRIAPLTLGQTTFGSILNPFDEQQWTFNAIAGEQITFNLINEIDSGLVYTLIGPNGYTGFSNITASSPLVNLPSTGTYTLLVEGMNGASGNYSFAVDPTTQTSLPLNSSINGELAGSSQAELFTIAVPSVQALLVSLTDNSSADSNELYLRFGAPPTRATYDYRYSSADSADQSILVPSAAIGTWYVLLYAANVPVASTFSLSANGYPLRVVSSIPSALGNSAPETLSITGAGFEPGAAVTLIGPGGSQIAASSTTVVSYTQLTANFPAAVPPGTYSVEVAANTGSDTLANALTITSGGVAHLETALTVPKQLGRHTAATIDVTYANDGTVAMPAPLLVLSCTDPQQIPLMTLDSSKIGLGLWTSSIPAGYSNTIEILASGAVPGVLEPGESITVPVYWAGLQQPWAVNDPNIPMNLGVIYNTDATPVNWASYKASIQPAQVPAQAWNQIFSNLTAELGSTWGQFVSALDTNAAYLGGLGENINDVSSLWQFMYLQADDALGPVNYLQTVFDASLPLPDGGTLSFWRNFNLPISSRYASGILGTGWSVPYQSNLVFSTGDTEAVLETEGEMNEVFPVDTRGGFFPDGAGDTLTDNGGLSYTITASDGETDTYSAAGVLEYHTDGHGNTITFGYDGSGQLISMTAGTGQSISLTYNAAGLLATLTTSQGQETVYNYDPSNQYLTSVDSFDGSTSYTYNQSNDELLSVVNSDGTYTDLSYDALGRLLTMSSAIGSLTLSYNQPGEISGTDALGNTSSEFFNENDLMLKAIDALGNPRYYQYDDDGDITSVTDAAGNTARWTYDDSGNLTSQTNPLGFATTYTYDSGGQLASQTDADGNTTSYSYDSNGNLSAINYANGTQEQFTVNSLGEATTVVQPNGQAITYTYDNNGNVTQEAFADGTKINYTYDTFGKILTATDSSGTTNFTYNAVGELTSIVYPNNLSLTYTYNSAGQVIKTVDQSGYTLHYTYDSAGRPWQVENGSGTPIATYTYNAMSQLVQQTNGNGTYTTYAYDAGGNLLHMINYAPGGSINSRFDYTYNLLNEITSMTTLDGTWSYSYDAADQLTGATFTSTNPAIPNQNLAYNYDPVGNRTSTVINGVTTNYTVDAMNQYTSIGGLPMQYDANGNLIYDGTTTYTYNDLNQLVGTSSATALSQFTYDALGERTSATINGQTTQYLVDPFGSGQPVAEYDGNGNLLMHINTGPDVISETLANGTQYYDDTDPTGSIVGISNSSGAYVDTYDYLPFGSILFSTGSLANSLQFGGDFNQQTYATSLVAIGARDYNPITGSFITSDPLQTTSGSISFYDYAQNNPVQNVDPSGLKAITYRYGNPQLYQGSENPSGFGPSTITTYAAGVFQPLSEFNEAAEQVGGPFYETAKDVLKDIVFHQEVPSLDEIENTFEDAAFSALNNGPLAVFNVGTILEQLAKPDMAVNIVNGINGIQRSHLCGTINAYEAAALVEIGMASPGCENAPGVVVPQAPAGSGVTANSSIASSFDPNDKIGPGYGPQGYVAAGSTLPYRVNFENDPSASAPAQQITITDQLSSNLDWTSFRITSIGWGDTVLTVPANSQQFQDVVSMTYDGDTFNVMVQMGINLLTGVITAQFYSIDPTTNLPPDVLIGFLPPEDGTGRGQGFISYTVAARANLADGTQITNVAAVVFDAGTVVTTDQLNDDDPTQGTDPSKRALVTIDSVPPTSTVAALPATESSSTFTVSWSGQDEPGGSGVASYSVYVSDDGGAYQPFVLDTASTSASFTGQTGHTYSFYSIATDNVGNVQPTPTSAQATTTVSASSTSTPAITGISPSSGPATGGVTVIINGAGFTGATAVYFGTTLATSFTVNSTGTQITVIAPPGAVGTTVDITVMTPGGTSATSAADQFTILPGWLAAGSAAAWNASTHTLTVTGAAAIIADPGSDEPNIVASGAAAKLTISPATSPADVHIGGITLTDGASIVMSDVDASQVADGTNASNHHSDHNVLVIGTLGAVNDPTISIDSTSKIDLGDNDLIVHTGSSDQGTDDVQGFPETTELKAIEALAVEGRNVAPGGVYNGTWTGNGLTSSAAATADDSANAGYEQNILAVEQNSDMYLGGCSSWTVGSATEKLGANDIIVKYTYNGDLNLDGAVDGNAATIFSTFYDNGATSGNIYAYGDLNGDGKIDGNDATIFSTVYGNGLAGSGLPQL